MIATADRASLEWRLSAQGAQTFLVWMHVIHAV
ncbi:hypothetical protein SAMN05414139_02283 [Burkholderia sp. D7]|jgi:hypothetical protein|nr:hypothetical protein [Caballeronia mineralivorans]SOE63267.1 hypothetical protein SAMN05414139_02283 [Burkholderia sp. D7]